MDALSSVTTGPSISEQVYRSLRASLLEGAYPSGAQLSEAGLAQRLDVSRAPVREALERLVQEGLLVRRPRRGTFVRSYDRAQVGELMELRGVLETAAAHLAVVRASDEELDALRRLLDAADAATRRGEGYPPDRDFHRALTVLAKNGELARVTGLVFDQLRLARALSTQRSGRAREAWREHAGVLRALVARDVDGVDAALAAHLAAAEAAMLAWVDRDGTPPQGSDTERRLRSID